jgi:hypothetical protein
VDRGDRRLGVVSEEPVDDADGAVRPRKRGSVVTVPRLPCGEFDIESLERPRRENLDVPAGVGPLGERDHFVVGGTGSTVVQTDPERIAPFEPGIERRRRRVLRDVGRRTGRRRDRELGVPRRVVADEEIGRGAGASQATEDDQAGDDDRGGTVSLARGGAF